MSCRDRIVCCFPVNLFTFLLKQSIIEDRTRISIMKGNVKMGKLFGTDGIRGVANRELTAELAFRTGRSGAYVLTKNAGRRPRIIIGKDTRKSGDMLEAALTAGLCSVGAKVIPLGVIPTPAVAYLVRLYKADAGVVISASHKPRANITA